MGVKRGTLDQVFQRTAENQMVDRYPGVSKVRSKLLMAMQLRRAQDMYPERFAFVPETWIYPSEKRLMEEEMIAEDGPYIAKPSDSNQADGIFLCKSFYELKSRPGFNLKERGWVIQKYIGDPLLIDGKKFDLRLYVVITSIEPFRAYICREGIVRLCTVDYSVPKTEGDLRDLNAHLTNYSINKNATCFIKATDAHGSKSNKRSLSSIMNLLRRAGYDPEKLWKNITNVCEATARASMIPALRVMCQKTAKQGSTRGRCFHLFGFDILLDQNLNAYILEVNSRPSMKITGPDGVTVSPVDHHVKTTAYRGAIRILLQEKEVDEMGDPVPFDPREHGYDPVHNNEVGLLVLRQCTDAYLYNLQGFADGEVNDMNDGTQWISALMLCRLVQVHQRWLMKRERALRDHDENISSPSGSDNPYRKLHEKSQIEMMWLYHYGAMRKLGVKISNQLEQYLAFCGFLQELAEKEMERLPIYTNEDEQSLASVVGDILKSVLEKAE